MRALFDMDLKQVDVSKEQMIRFQRFTLFNIFWVKVLGCPCR